MNAQFHESDYALYYTWQRWWWWRWYQWCLQLAREMIKCSFMEEKEERNIWYLRDADLIISEWNERAYYINVESFLCLLYIFFPALFSSFLPLLFYYIFPILVNVLFVIILCTKFVNWKYKKIYVCAHVCIYMCILCVYIYIYVCIIYIYMHTCTDICTYICAYFIFFLMLGSQRNFHNCHLLFLWKFRNSQILKWKADNFSIFRFTLIHFFEFHNSFLQESTKIM